MLRLQEFIGSVSVRDVNIETIIVDVLEFNLIEYTKTNMDGKAPFQHKELHRTK